MLWVRRISWTARAVEHLRRHQVNRGDVEAALRGPVYARRVYRGTRSRYEVLAKVPASGRVLLIVMEDESRGRIAVVSAWNADLRQRGLYERRAKGAP